MILTSMILAVIYIFLGRNNQVYVGKNGNGERQYKTRKFALVKNFLAFLGNKEMRAYQQFHFQHFIDIYFLRRITFGGTKFLKSIAFALTARISSYTALVSTKP